MNAKILRSAWLAGTLLVSPAVAAEREAPSQDSLHADLKAQACSSEYVIFGDTSHSDPAIMNFVAEKGTVNALQACGVEKIFLELKTEHQATIDALTSGQMSKADFVSDSAISIRGDLGALADMALALNEAGIEIYASDRSAQELDTMAHMPYIMQGLLAYGEIVADAGEEELAENIASFALGVQKLSDRDTDLLAEIVHANLDHPSFKKASDFFAEAERIKAGAPKRTDDSLLAEFVRAHKGEAERVAIIIGDIHPQDRETGIDVLLGPENTSWLTLAGQNGIMGKGTPDRIYDLTARKVIIPSPSP